MNEEIGMKDLWIMVSKILDNFLESIVLNHGIKKLMELIHGPEKMYGTYSVWTVELNHGLEKMYGTYSVWIVEPNHGLEKIYGNYSVWTVELNHGLEKMYVT